MTPPTNDYDEIPVEHIHTLTMWDANELNAVSDNDSLYPGIKITDKYTPVDIVSIDELCNRVTELANSIVPMLSPKASRRIVKKHYKTIEIFDHRLALASERINRVHKRMVYSDEEIEKYNSHLRETFNRADVPTVLTWALQYIILEEE